MADRIAGKIDDEHLKTVCLLGQGPKCCRYITCGRDGFACQKGTGLGQVIDLRVSEDSFKALGDNCEGKSINVVLQ